MLRGDTWSRVEEAVRAKKKPIHKRGKKGVKIRLKHQVFRPKRGKFAILSGGGADFKRTRLLRTQIA